MLVGSGAVAESLLRLPATRRGSAPIALVRRPARAAPLHALGARVLLGDLDQPASLQRIAAMARHLIMLAPPPETGNGDSRSQHLLQALQRHQGRLRRLQRHARWIGLRAESPASLPACGVRRVYVSTSGVYGDRGGAWIDETVTCRPESPRAKRRLAAEAQWRRERAAILRAPGIYSASRLPEARLRSGAPALLPEQDSWSNHIHEHDLARACRWALFKARPGRVYHVSDDAPMRMGDYFDAVADALEVDRPPRLDAGAVQALVSPMMWSFMRESRRLNNRRLREELGFVLRYPTVDSLLEELVGARGRTRTDTPFTAGDFESPASTDFATRARATRSPAL